MGAKLTAFLNAGNGDIKEIKFPQRCEAYDDAQPGIDQCKQGKEIERKPKPIPQNDYFSIYPEGELEIELWTYEKGIIAMNFQYPQEASKDHKEKVALFKKCLYHSTFKDPKFRALPGTSINLGGSQGEKSYNHYQLMSIRSSNVRLTEDLTVSDEGMQLFFSADTNNVTANNDQQIKGVVYDFCLALSPYLILTGVAGFIVALINIIILGGDGRKS